MRPGGPVDDGEDRHRLDQVSDASLPSSKEEWRLFLDAGVAVEELYAPL
jgi:hypothetical protein